MKRYPNRVAFRYLAMLTACVLVGLAPGGVQAQESIDLEAIANDLDAFGKRLTALRADIDQSRFDPDDKVERLDYDADMLIEFVKSKITFHPYAGVLRGAAGTLQSAAGNSLDQSLLLGYMLKSAGFDARIVRAELSDEDARRLLETTANARVPQTLEYLQSPKAEPKTGSSSSAGLKDTVLYSDTMRHAQQLTKVLGEAGLTLKPADATAVYLPLTRDYFWVQHRESPTQDWQNAHPAFGGAEPPDGLEPAEFFTESIPEKFHHTFTISAWIEQWNNGTIKKHQIMKPWTSPAANLVGKVLRFNNAPSGLTKDTANNLEVALDNTTMLIPMFNDVMAPGAQIFDLKGRIIDPFTLGGGGAAGFFQTMGDKVESATSGLADREDGKPVLALHSMYLEFTFTGPDGKSDTRRRYLLAPRNDYADDKSILWSLITDHSYTVAVGDMPVDFIADRFLEANIAGLDWLEFTIRKAFEPDIGAALPGEFHAGLAPLVQQWSMDRQPQGDDDTIRFRKTPGLVGIRRGYRDAHTGFTAVDVVFNRVEFVSKTNEGLASAPKAELRNGVWDTVLESVPAKLRQSESGTQISAVRIFDLASQQGISTRVLMPGQIIGPDQLGLDDNARSFVQDDLERGYAVVLPSRLPEGAGMAGWWRVQPDSGETLGMTGDGYGQETTEYLIEMVGNVKGLVDALNSIQKCEEEPSMAERLCCLLNAHADNVAGLALGGFMGEAFGTSAAAVFDIANSTAQNTTGQGLVPSVGPMDCSSIPTDW